MCAKRHGRDSWWEERTTAQKVFMGIGFGILGAGFMFAIGLVTMLLWNALMPAIFGLTTITYWQTWGLLLLSFIFFKNWGSGESSGRKDRKRKRHLRRYMSEDGPSGWSDAGNDSEAANGPLGDSGTESGPTPPEDK